MGRRLQKRSGRRRRPRGRACRGTHGRGDAGRPRVGAARPRPADRLGGMRFPYQSYLVRGIGTTRYALVHRPVIPVRIIGPKGDDNLLVLADTGADDTLLPDYLIGRLGVVLTPGDQAVIVSIDGSTSLVRHGLVDLVLPGYRWSARVGFHATFSTNLGHIGFLDHFTARFNDRRRHITLTPNGTAPAPTMPTP